MAGNRDLVRDRHAVPGTAGRIGVTNASFGKLMTLRKTEFPLGLPIVALRHYDINLVKARCRDIASERSASFASLIRNRIINVCTTEQGEAGARFWTSRCVSYANAVSVKPRALRLSQFPRQFHHRLPGIQIRSISRTGRSARRLTDLFRCSYE
jgi:hypothetical protein